MNIIIVGCGKVGQKLTEKLSQEGEHNITVIDLKNDVIQGLTGRFDIMGVVGSGSNLDTLIDAGIKDTDILIAVTGSDELNLLTCLIAKRAGNCQTIARVRKPEYKKEISLVKGDLGLAMIINPEQTAAQEMARVLRFPSAIQIDTFAKGRVEILKFRIPEDSVLDNLTVADISNKLNCDVLVCGVQRQDDAFIPRGDFILKTNDYISIISSIENGAEFFKKIGFKTNSVKDTIIVGGGATGYYLADLLIKSGIYVKIIEQNESRCNELCELLPKATVIQGDGTDKNVLTEEGLNLAQSFVSLTNIDEENIMLSLYAKSKMNGKIITKINRIDYGDLINTLNLDTIIYPKDIAAEYILKFVRAKSNSQDNDIETIHLILDDKAEALEFRIHENSPVANQSIEHLSLKDNVIIACINRNGNIITPRGKDVILPNDTVIVVTTHKGLQGISDIMEQ